MKIVVDFEADDSVLQGWYCMKLKVWKKLQVQLKEIGRIWT